MTESDHLHWNESNEAGSVQALYEHAPVAMVELSGAGDFSSPNAAFRRLFGEGAVEGGGTVTELLSNSAVTSFMEQLDTATARQRDRIPSPVLMMTAAGEQLMNCVLTSLPALSTSPSRSLLTVFDGVVGPVRSEQYFEKDALTGLYSEAAFFDLVEAFVAQHRGQPLALVMIGCSSLADEHLVPDDLLVAIAEVCTRRLRKSDSVARCSGARFWVALPHTSLHQATFVAELLVHDLRNQIMSEGPAGFEQMTFAAGVARVREGRTVSATVLAARACLGEATSGTGGVVTEAEASGSNTESEAATLDFNSLVLFGQVIAEASSGTPTNVELFVRALNASGIAVPASEVIPLAERLGRVGRIDRWIIGQAVEAIAHDADGSRRYHLNLSGRTLSDPHLMVFLESELSKSGIDPSRLVIELTEAAALFDVPFATEFASYLGGLGCKFAIDHVGLDGGSLHYLSALPFDYLKIDGTFVRACATNTADRLVVEAIVAIAHGLGKKTIACSVEDADTLRTVQECGVDFVQGFLIGAPVLQTSIR